jgi:hypothetical protein
LWIDCLVARGSGCVVVVVVVVVVVDYVAYEVVEVVEVIGRCCAVVGEKSKESVYEVGVV